VALIQGSLDTVFDVSPQRIQETFDHYRRLTSEAVSKHPNLDLVAWPESMFAVSESVIEEPMAAPPESGLSAEQLRERLAAIHDDFRNLMANEAERANSGTEPSHAGTKLLVGTTTYVYGLSGARIYNAALLADRSGEIVGRYYKTHPVMFGEYIPLGQTWPWIYKLTPMSGGLSVGEGPTVFPIAGLKMSPSICFESTIPHLIRGQLRQLEQRGTPADCLINVTNDGWFWGTGMLDLHFRCGVFRAVENRKPLLVVANTGISTFVDGNGVIRERGPRRREQVLVAEVQADGRKNFHAWAGDVPAWFCAAGCIGLAVIGLQRRRARRSSGQL
jgi:apolipoprotein N-acyltransferase